MSDIETEVHRTLLRHAWGFDDGDWELLASAYTEDATMEIVTDGMSFTPHEDDIGTSAVGKDDLMRLYRAGYDLIANEGNRPWHLITDVLVESYDETSARVRSVNLFLKSSPEGASLYGLSRYYDEMVRVDDDWLIKSRINRVACMGTGNLL